MTDMSRNTGQPFPGRKSFESAGFSLSLIYDSLVSMLDESASLEKIGFLASDALNELDECCGHLAVGARRVRAARSRQRRVRNAG
jgi:hypothetical protein